MPSLDIHNAEIGTITSRSDHSVAFRVVTPELRPSEAGALMQWHGKACRVTIHPHERAPDEVLSVTTEREGKTPSSRVRAVLFILWKQDGQEGTFEAYYQSRMDRIIEKLKEKINE